jgi:hypothetical protein
MLILFYTNALLNYLAFQLKLKDSNSWMHVAGKFVQ